MNGIVKWLLIMLICTIFALDCIFLLSFNAGAIVVCQKPVVNFTPNITGGCTTSVVQFTDQSTNNPKSRPWDVGDSGTASIQNPFNIYANPETSAFKLNPTNSVVPVPEPIMTT
jgi:PKD repeat protein